MMDPAHAIPQSAVDGPRRRTTGRRRLWPALPLGREGSRQEARARRVVLLLAGVWIVGMFDLGFTLLAHRLGGFQEANPVVAQFVHVPRTLVIFKLATLLCASAIFLKFRRRRFTEIACWAVCIVHVVLAFVWMNYYTIPS